MKPINGEIIKGFEQCPKCKCSIVVRKAPGMTQAIARAYAMVEHTETIHKARLDWRRA